MSLTRARPVPFCRHSLRPDPETSARCFTLWVPLRRPAMYACTASWIRCWLYGYPKISSGNSISRTCLLSKFLIAIFIRLSPFRPPDRYVSGNGTRHGTAHVDQVLLGVDLDDQQVLRRDAGAAHPAGHPHALQHSRGVGGGADGARREVEHRAVAALAAAEVVPLHDALITLALAGADDVDPLFFLEDGGLHLVAGVELLARRHVELLHSPHRRHTGLLEVSRPRLAHLRRALFHQADLDRLVAVHLGRLALYHQTGPGLDHRHRDRRPVLDEDLSHPHLASQNAIHRGLLTFRTP